MAKKLKLWNGRGHGKFERGHFYVAAYSAEQASFLMAIASGYKNTRGFETELRVYYSKGCWGNSMNGIVPTDPCIYAEKNQFSNEPPVLIHSIPNEK